MSQRAVRGFVLQPTYRIQSGRPVVHLYGRLENGGSFLVQDDRLTPHFYIAARQAEQAGQLGAPLLVDSSLQTWNQEAAARVELRIPSHTPALRNRFIKHGIACYEADIRFAILYLISKGVRGSVELEGEWEAQEGAGRVYRNPEVRPSRWRPQLSVLSFDIETDPQASRLLSIALYGCGVSEVLLLEAGGRTPPEGATAFPDQEKLIRAFCRRVREIDPDILTGWNVIDFDLQVLDRLAGQSGISMEMGRTPGALRLRPSRSPWNNLNASLPGRVVLDGIELLRTSFLRYDSYALDFVARRVLGKGKTLQGEGRGEEILHNYNNDLERFVEYNLNDAQLVLDILQKLNLMELAVERSLLTGLPVNRVAGSIASFDFLYLSQLHKKGIVAPSVGSGTDDAAANLGGHVMEPQVGLYDNVCVFDFKSLYPSLIRTFQIDPLNHIHGPQEGQDLIRAPNGAAFARKAGILPGLLDELFPRREAAKSQGDKVASYAIKILMNSFYGVLGTPACRFYSPPVAGAITAFGREILLWSKARLESYGFRVLYGDTDSLFVLSGQADGQKARHQGLQLVKRLNRELAEHIYKKWRVESRLELEFERLYRKLHLPHMRRTKAGARKRYAGLADEDGSTRVIFTGMEVVRRDWTDLAKQIQRELYQRLFHGEDLEQYLHQMVAELRQGVHDELLVYRKALRKGLDEYTATTPPHVAAARKMSSPPGRLVAYLMTSDGPEPAAERRNPIDHQHYVQKQIRPVAEPILELKGLDFAEVIGDQVQLRLF